MDVEIRLLASKRDALFRKFNKHGSRTIYIEFLRQLQLVEERTERAICTFMCNKLSDALEDNKNFWKDMVHQEYFGCIGPIIKA